MQSNQRVPKYCVPSFWGPIHLMLSSKTEMSRGASNLAARALLLAMALLWISSSESPAQRRRSPIDANQLVTRTVANELKATEENRSRWRYSLYRQKQDKTYVFQAVQTKDGTITYLVRVDGRPLTEEERKKEDARIRKLISDPDEQRKEQEKSRSDIEKLKQLLEMLPRAFIFRVDGRQGRYIRLNFKPDPAFDPPSREARVLHGMTGTMLVEPTEARLRSLSGQLFEDVEFGGGLFGHLDKGGSFEVEQSEVKRGYWFPTSVRISLKGKALFFKTIDLRQYDVYANFRPVPDGLSLAEAAELLEKAQTDTASKAR
jgi:hypothetical protein